MAAGRRVPCKVNVMDCSSFSSSSIKDRLRAAVLGRAMVVVASASGGGLGVRCDGIARVGTCESGGYWAGWKMGHGRFDVAVCASGGCL